MTAGVHPWRLVSPWYRWHKVPSTHPRDTAPVLQKYETAGLVDLFLANPQHSLQFTDEDHVFEEGARVEVLQIKGATALVSD